MGDSPANLLLPQKTQPMVSFYLTTPVYCAYNLNMGKANKLTGKRYSNPVVPPPQQKLDVPGALKLRLVNNHTYKEIGDYYGVKPKTVSAALRKLLKEIDDPALNAAYRDGKVEVLTGMERVIASDLMDPAKRKKASLNNAAYALKVVHEIGRLERGESTSNVSVRALTESVESRQERIEELKKQVGGW